MSAPVTTQWITVADGGEGYLCLPPAGHGPGLVLFQEIFGVNAHIRTVAEQYALSGFVVLAPDVFWRAAPRVELGYQSADIERGMQFAGQVACPIQFHYAGRDDHIPPAAVQSVRDAFVGKSAEIFVYPGAMHGFNCWARSAYHPASAALAQGRSLAFLADKLFLSGRARGAPLPDRDDPLH